LVPQVHCIYQNTLPYRFPVTLSIKNLSPNVIPADSLDMYLYMDDSLVIHERYGKDIPPYGIVNVELNQYLDIYQYQSVVLRAELKSSFDHIEENNVIDDYNVNFLKAIHTLPVEYTF